MGRKAAWSFFDLMENIDKVRTHTFKRNNEEISASITEMIEARKRFEKMTPKSLEVTRKLFDDFIELVEGKDRQWLMKTLRYQRYEGKRKRISVDEQIADRLQKCYSEVDDKYFDMSDFLEHLLDLYDKSR